MFGRKALQKEIDKLQLQVDILERRLLLQALKRHQASKKGWISRRGYDFAECRKDPEFYKQESAK